MKDKKNCGCEGFETQSSDPVDKNDMHEDHEGFFVKSDETNDVIEGYTGLYPEFSNTREFEKKDKIKWLTDRVMRSQRNAEAHRGKWKKYKKRVYFGDNGRVLKRFHMIGLNQRSRQKEYNNLYTYHIANKDTTFGYRVDLNGRSIDVTTTGVTANMYLIPVGASSENTKKVSMDKVRVNYVDHMPYDKNGLPITTTKTFKASVSSDDVSITRTDKSEGWSDDVHFRGYVTPDGNPIELSVDHLELRGQAIKLAERDQGLLIHKMTPYLNNTLVKGHIRLNNIPSTLPYVDIVYSKSQMATKHGTPRGDHNRYMQKNGPLLMEKNDRHDAYEEDIEIMRNRTTSVMALAVLATAAAGIGFITLTRN
jgi:hypothetical protein